MSRARLGLVVVILVVLFGVPWAVTIGAAHWPAAVPRWGSVAFLVAMAAFPVLMVLGHGRRHLDAAARAGDTLLGTIWIGWAAALLGAVPQPALLLAQLSDVRRFQVYALTVLGVWVALLAWGNIEARRLPRTRTVEVWLPRMGPALDGLRVVVLADTHFGPIDRTAWSRRVAARVNELAPDVVCHVGDLADGGVAQRRAQVEPLGTVTGTKLYITGNHEYFSAAQDWLDHMAGLGWLPLHNRHHVVCRGADRLVFAGVDDPTGASSALPGHGPDLAAALDGVDPDVPVVLLAHQPKQVTHAVDAGVDLQLSGHTHGGQIWPFHLIVSLDQKTLSGLTRPGPRTQLYTSRGAGFWGPPFRVFAPSEISVLILRAVV